LKTLRKITIPAVLLAMAFNRIPKITPTPDRGGVFAVVLA
jgi:hypothetical protein